MIYSFNKNHLSVFVYTTLIFFFFIWKANSYLINGLEQQFIDSLLSNYEFNFQNTEEDRKYFRRYGILFFNQYYLIINDFLIFLNLNQNYLIYCYYFTISLSLSGGVFFSIKSIQKIYNNNFYITWISLLSLVLYIVAVGKINDAFSHFEFFIISGCLYSSLNKKKILFLIFVFLGIINRETGIILGIIYFFLNRKNTINFFILIIPIILFLILNYNLFNIYPSNFDFKNIFLIKSDPSVRVNILNLYNLELKKIAGYLIYTSIIYLPIIYKINKVKILENKYFLLLFLIFFSIALFGTFLGNIYPHLIVVPFWGLLFFKKNKHLVTAQKI